MSPRSRSPRANGGFTLLELLVVIAIITTLAAVVAPSLFRNVGDAKTASARSQVELLALALHQYALDNASYPTTAQGLAALRAVPAELDVVRQQPRNWRGPYLTRDVPLDPWGRPYAYLSPGTANPTSFDIYSLGRDGAVGGEGEDADITSWGGSGPSPLGANGVPPLSPALVHP